ncbi:unnamed protein product [Sphagnum tenellum]
MKILRRRSTVRDYESMQVVKLMQLHLGSEDLSRFTSKKPCMPANAINAKMMTVSLPAQCPVPTANLLRLYRKFCWQGMLVQSIKEEGGTGGTHRESSKK